MEESKTHSRAARRAGYAVFDFVRSLFRLDLDTDHDGTVVHIKRNVDFSGGNLWALVLAILIASVGLNVNSTAVIIGAMLISPLMGPIMGAGLGLGINDLPLLRRSVRSLAIAAGVSILASALYFGISPLNEAQSELLARTRPTLYDVLIAFFGGAAGIIAASRKGDKGNVVPGVAIATALVPPLCTAGFGLATGAWQFFFGALYLFLINSVFICLATVGIVRLLHFPRVHELDPARAKRVRMVMASAAFVTVLPSIYVGSIVVRETLFLAGARRFLADNLTFVDRSVVTTNVRFGRDSSLIEATLVGRPLPPEVRQDLERRLDSYGLKRTRLTIREPMESGAQVEELGRAVRVGILEDLYRKNEEALLERDTQIRVLEDEVVRLRATELPITQIATEAKALYPGLRSMGFGRNISMPDTGKADTTVSILTGWQRQPPAADLAKLRAFLQLRLALDSVDLVARVER